MSERRLISSGGPWEEQVAYSRAVVQGDWCFVSGTTSTASPEPAAQADAALGIIAAALDEGGFTMADVVRVRYLLPDASDFEECWPVLRRWFGDVRPAATMQQCGLIDPAMRIEIEATAYRG
ncbi:RidA family protein [Demequina mangrovi]|uniref:Enamine deaminase RidA, house cleaning of reactive enamine intermediates, YjgF/YER057c/UK114 family n=1 Tax=Demequina mangrovi TaxID=1043493 RepID=A0A1H6Y287_9MICO|nr:RidA family protein [Demequina mangrovi]SEJ34576.1 Enamine deaminase RidA, house cleaning of reactive enamine intermediates, YjgF/YER057c/UK114 family [Demequina mangrovi]